MKTVTKYLIELVIVFFGVFLAFLLNDYQNNKEAEEKKLELYRSIYEDLDRFVAAGDTANAHGFVNMFVERDKDLAYQLSIQDLDPLSIINGDYWNIEIISTLLNSGSIDQLDIGMLKIISRYHTTHSGFTQQIEKYNEFYLEFVTKRYSDKDPFFKVNGQLKPEYAVLPAYSGFFVTISQTLVDEARRIKKKIREEYLEE